MIKQDLIDYCHRQADEFTRLSNECLGDLYRDLTARKALQWRMIATSIGTLDAFRSPRVAVEGDL